MAGPGCATHLEADECARREFIEPSRAEPNPRAEGSGSGESSAAVEACGVPPIPPPSGSGESSDEAERAPSSAAASAASSLAYCSHFCACRRDAGGKGPGFPRVSWLQDNLKCCAPAGLLRAKSLWGLCGGECPEDTRRSAGASCQPRLREVAHEDNVHDVVCVGIDGDLLRPRLRRVCGSDQ